MTKVDYQALDRLPIKPLGIYGSRNEIVKFLLDIKGIDEEMYVEILSDVDLI